MKFKAENFEATATHVNGGDWVVESPGNTSHSIRLEILLGDAGACTVTVLRETGWLPLTKSTKPRPLEKDLATAIAVLYSVPGVVCVEEPE